MEGQSLQIAVIGASGFAGKAATQGFLKAGHQVLAVVRDPTKLQLSDPNLDIVKGDASNVESLQNVLKGGLDIVFAAVSSAKMDVPHSDRTDISKSLIEALTANGQKPRIFALGGLGVLPVSPAVADKPQVLLRDTPNFPPMFAHVSKDHYDNYNYLQSTGLEFTFICPPQIIEGATDQYLLAADSIPKDGKWTIGAGDIANFTVKELIERKYLNVRVGIMHAP